LARKTYEGLAAYWSPLKDAWANLINPKPKYVASRTLHGPLEWNATLLEGDAPDAVSRLEAELPSDLLLDGCGELARVSSRGNARRRTPILGSSCGMGRRGTPLAGRGTESAAPPRM